MAGLIGAIHLGWDVLAVAAGGGRWPIRALPVENELSPPAYILADATGALHTSGAVRERPDLGLAISDVRDILGYPEIVIAGARWPADAVFRARLFNPINAIVGYFGRPPDLIALPYPDGWSDYKIGEFAHRAGSAGIEIEPIPQSVSLSGYVREFGVVPEGSGATVVWSDGRGILLVAVHADYDRPTESLDIPLARAAFEGALAADEVVLEVLGAARSMGADTSTFVLAGKIVENDHIRFAFKNQLGSRLLIADLARHAVALGAAALLAAEDDEYDAPPPPPQQQQPPPPPPLQQQPPALQQPQQQLPPVGNMYVPPRSPD